jgi:hypothetical protein
MIVFSETEIRSGFLTRSQIWQGVFGTWFGSVFFSPESQYFEKFTPKKTRTCLSEAGAASSCGLYIMLHTVYTKFRRYSSTLAVYSRPTGWRTFSLVY